MVEMKYVVVDGKDDGEQLFIFPKTIDHDQFADVLNFIKVGHDRNWKRIYRKPISAGFTDGVTCYGRSESLHLESRKEDQNV